MQIKSIITYIATIGVLMSVCTVSAADIFNLQESYAPITGTTVEERFLERKSELPSEIPAMLPGDASDNITYYVSSDGNDLNRGTKTYPFKTIDKALSVSANADASKVVTIYLREGEYQFGSPSVYCTRMEAAPLIISAYENESVALTADKVIRGDMFSRVTQDEQAYRLPESAKNKVLAVNLAELGIADYGEITASSGAPLLYYNNEKMTLARWPNYSENGIGDVIDIGPITASGSALGDGMIDDGRGFEFKLLNTRPLTWKDSDDIWMYGSFYAEWFKQNVKVRQFNKEQKSVRTYNSAVYGARKLDENTHYYYNVFEELDVPGEWYLDRDTGKLYIYPLDDDLASASIHFCNSYATLLNITNSSNIIINGINFLKTRGVGVKITNSENIKLQNCTFSNLGSHGVYISDSKNCGIIGSDIKNTGKTGIYITEGKPSGELIPKRNYIQNCMIADITDAGGIFVRGVGNVISHNLIKNIGATGISIDHANECIAEYNEITACAKKIDDCGAIYITGYGDSRGNHIRYNYIHDLRKLGDSGPQGVYFDDMSSDNYAYGNIIARNGGNGGFVHNGAENVFFNNIFIGSTSAVKEWSDYYTSFGDNYWKSAAVGMNSLCAYMDTDNAATYIDVTKQPWKGRYPTLLDFTSKMKRHIEERSTPGYTRNELENQLRSPHDNLYKNNLIVNSGNISLSDIGLTTAIGMETNYVTTSDPGFADMNRKDYTIIDNADVYTKINGFEAPPFDKMGLSKSIYGTYAQIIAPDLLMPKPDAESSQTVDFSWAPVEGAAYYILTVAKNLDFSDEVLTEYIYNTNYTAQLNGIGQRYYWHVTAVDTSREDDGIQKTSETQCFTIAASPEHKEILSATIYTGLSNILVEGTLPEDEDENAYVQIIMLKKGSSLSELRQDSSILAHIGQIQAGENRRYEYKFKIQGNPGEYNLYARVGNRDITNNIISEEITHDVMKTNMNISIANGMVSVNEAATAKLSAEIENYYGDSETSSRTLFLAAYDSHTRLIGCRMLDMNPLTYQIYTNASVDMTLPDGTAEVKGFMVDKQTMRPFIPSVEKNKE